MAGKTRQFPAWLQRTITIMAVLGGAWYLIGSWVACVFCWGGAGRW